MKIIIWTLFILLNLAVHSKGIIPKTLPGKVLCGKNKIADWTVNNSTTLCRECPVCPIYYGSTFPCGGVMMYPHEKPIRCERCINGKTFSNSRNTDMCSPCTNCLIRNRKVLETCDIFKDTVCGECEDGYYEFRNESTGNKTCEKCSRCCDDGKENKIQECIDQGLQSSGEVCSVFEKERCKPNSRRSHQESPTDMTHQNDRMVSFTTTQLIENEQGASEGPNVVVAAVVPVVLGVMVALIGLYWCKKKKNSNGSDEEQGGNEIIEPLNGNHWHRDSKSKFKMSRSKSLKIKVLRAYSSQLDPVRSDSLVL